MAQGKRIRSSKEGLNPEKIYSLNEALGFFQGSYKKAKFDETVEIAIQVSGDQNKPDQTFRGAVLLPAGRGKAVRVAVFATGKDADEAKKAGAEIVGDEDLAAEVAKGKINFDVCIATPAMMPLIGKLGKVLGPKGLMPNPKVGTVTPNVAEAVKNVKAGQVEFKPEKTGIVHAGVALLSFPEKDIATNIKAVVGAIQKARPAGIKGTFIKGIVLSTTMGPGLKVDVSELIAA